MSRWDGTTNVIARPAGRPFGSSYAAVPRLALTFSAVCSHCRRVGVQQFDANCFRIRLSLHSDKHIRNGGSVPICNNSYVNCLKMTATVR